MHIRILDLDGSIPLQQSLCNLLEPEIINAQNWAPWIRMACSFGRFRRFERAMTGLFGCGEDRDPTVTFIGSGDFHHVSLALLHRQRQPFNLLIIDNHPDWMRGVPFLHCGTWVYHAAKLPLLGRIFHVGGDVDFDNYYRWLAPWRLLRTAKIKVLGGIRPFMHGGWSRVPNEPLRPTRDAALTVERVKELVKPFSKELAQRPLYISLDKDAMNQDESLVNWDSGSLTLGDVQTVLRAFLETSGGVLAGVDIVGDWSPVNLRGWLRHLMHFTEHPSLEINPAQATRRNEQTNLALLDCLRQYFKKSAHRANEYRACRF